MRIIRTRIFTRLSSTSVIFALFLAFQIFLWCRQGVRRCALQTSLCMHLLFTTRFQSQRVRNSPHQILHFSGPKIAFPRLNCGFRGRATHRRHVGNDIFGEIWRNSSNFSTFEGVYRLTNGSCPSTFQEGWMKEKCYLLWPDHIADNKYPSAHGIRKLIFFILNLWKRSLNGENNPLNKQIHPFAEIFIKKTSLPKYLRIRASLGAYVHV